MGLTRGNVFPSRYLGKDDVLTPIRGTIADVRLETITTDRGDEDKAVMAFSEADMKPMIVNSTNWDALEAAYGPDTDGWMGKPVEIYIDPGVSYGGRRVGGVRVRIPSNGPPPALPKNRSLPQPPPATAGGLRWSEAVALAASVGMNEDDLKTALKGRGLASYNPRRDRAAVEEIVAAAGTPAGEEIPF